MWREKECFTNHEHINLTVHMVLTALCAFVFLPFFYNDHQTVGKMDGGKIDANLEQTPLDAAKNLKLGQRFTLLQENKPKMFAKATVE